MTDLQTRINSILQIFANNSSKVDKVVSALKAFSGLDITHFTAHQKESINKYLSKINKITSHYLVKTYDDYKIISNPDLDKILNSVQELCFNLLVDLKSSDQCTV
jgi:hypothetical protein